MGFIHMKPCVHDYQLLMSLKIKCHKSLGNCESETIYYGVSFIQSFICILLMWHS